MKTIKQFFAILIITLLTISCSHSDSNSSATPTPSATDYFLKAKIDGVQYTADASHVIGGETTGGSGRITINSIGSNQSFIFTIDYPTASGTGTYSRPVPSGMSYILRLEYDEAGSGYLSGDCGTTGTLVITAISATEVSGTFSFIGKKGLNCAVPSNKVITEGSFKVRIS